MTQETNRNSNTPNIHGIVPPLVTPLSAQDELDHAGLERLVEHVIDGGVHGVFILGSTGEAPSLSYHLRREVIDRVTKQVAGRVPVLVGITDTAFVESVNLAKHAADAGVDAVVSTTPYYFPTGQTELLDFIRNLEAELPLPLVLYNMPAMTKIWFELETLQALTEIDSIIGIKDSSGDLEYFEKLTALKKTRPDWSVTIGTEVLLPKAIAMGADGAVAGGGQILPQLFSECYESLVAGDEAKTAELMPQIEAFQAIYDVGKYASRHLKATKCCLSLLGICDDLPAHPFHRFNPPERQKVAAVLDGMGVLPDGAV